MTAQKRGPHPIPAWMWIPAGFGALFLVAPLTILLARTPWHRSIELLTSPIVYDALRISVLTATIATALALLFGLPLAWCLGTRSFRGIGALRLAVTIPLVLPPVVGGAALLFTYGRTAPWGSALWEVFGVTIPFTQVAVVLAQLFVAMPFLIVSLEGAFRSQTGQLEEAAATLGAGPWTIFRRVTLPAVRPALLGGIALCWARAMGEFGATITFAGSIRSVTQTLPVAINELLGHDLEAAMMASALMIILSAIVIVTLRGRWIGG